MTTRPTDGAVAKEFAASGNMPAYTVAELSQKLKSTIEDRFSYVKVRGEIGECKLHSSGHLYLSLKDENALLAAVCWRGQVSRLGLKPAQGMDVVCSGRLTTYPGQSKYQLVVEKMELAGVGAILQLLEERRKKLAAEGLFDPARKKPLPFLPEVIGVVTSPTGAVIRDILHRLADRFPRDVYIWPVAVQGENAAQQIAAAIRGFNALTDHASALPRPDVIIVARGGGSLEDLMPFNEEVVVRAAAESRIPLISAVGHETDTTLIDYAADKRAPTPTAAAEMAVPVRELLVAETTDLAARLKLSLQRILQDKRDKTLLLARVFSDTDRFLEPLSQRLDERSERFELAARIYLQTSKAKIEGAAGKLRHPRQTIALKMQNFEETARRLQMVWQNYADKKKEVVFRLAAMLEVLSPHAVLGRGYALVYDAQGKLVTSAASLEKGDGVALELKDGKRKAMVQE